MPCCGPAECVCASAPDMRRDAVGKQQQPVVREDQVRVALPASQLPVDCRQRRIGGAQHAREVRVALVLQRALVFLQPVLLLVTVRTMDSGTLRNVPSWFPGQIAGAGLERAIRELL